MQGDITPSPRRGQNGREKHARAAAMRYYSPMTSIESRYEVVDGYRVHYLVAGEGAPVLLVHGVGSSAIVYQRNIEALAQVARVYALDLPGHGLSAFADVDYSVESGGRFVCSFIEAVIGGEPTALIGISAGGLMCACAAAERPDLVARLVLVSSAGFGRDIGWNLRLLTLPLVDRFVETASIEQARGALERQVYDPEQVTPELVAAVYGHWQRPGNRRAFVTALRNNISVFGLRRWRKHLKRVSVIAMPVMIIWGKNDKTIPVKHAYRAVKRIGGAQLHILDRCGHMAPYERPQEFNRIVSEFLA
jgi:4,5:9,10-diseco-3-hydroxy-5,9,17-trioxoandrosta-1(10),2-diene-4-oate hydrolase